MDRLVDGLKDIGGWMDKWEDRNEWMVFGYFFFSFYKGLKI